MSKTPSNLTLRTIHVAARLTKRRRSETETDYFANVFVHFEPLGYSLREGQHISNDDEDSLESLYQEAWESQKRQQAKICRTNKACLEGGQVDLNAVEQTPYYIDPESKEGKRWMQSHPRARLVSLFTLLTTFRMS